MPYLGLETAQTVNMFANLRLEGCVRNYLALAHPPGPFGYLEDIVLIDDSGDDPGLEWYRRGGYAIVYCALCALPLRACQVHDSYRMLIHRSHHGSPPVVAFVDWLHDEFYRWPRGSF